MTLVCFSASAFSERYLGLPKPDRRAYEMANLAYRASQFVDKKFLIIHPTADVVPAEEQERNRTGDPHWRQCSGDSSSSGGSHVISQEKHRSWGSTKRRKESVERERERESARERTESSSSVDTGRCPQDAARRTLPAGRCPQDAAPQDAAHRTLPTGHCPTAVSDPLTPPPRQCHCSAEYHPPPTSYLLCGGSAQSSISLSLTCVFVLCQIYPDEGHFIHNEDTRQHLSQSLVNFFEECFRLPDYIFEEALEEESEDEG
ncbi:hypothetical protein NFI96_002385 [Prochilodus magdalenae]|nr:hypothetical protein NFI96_002385 [Prochilodus magdalenae]